MTAVVALHLVVGLTIIGFGGRLGRRALVVAAVPASAAAVGLGLWWSGGGAARTESLAWAPQLGLRIDLRLDGLAALMVLLIVGLGLLVLVYAREYFPPGRDGLGRLVGLLVCFSGSMLGLVLADNLLVLVTFWELTAITSFLLIGNDHRDGAARAAALQAILTTGLGGLAMLGGVILLGNAAGTYRLSGLLEDPPSGATTTVGLMLVLVGAASKSAQYPFHSWLPTAMVAPTPVSAYLHSATMVKAGVYLVARLALPFAEAPGWRPAVMTVGLVSMIAGGLRALRRTDMKALLAFGTISQLGFMFVLFGAGTEQSVQAGCVLLLAHGLFKAALFMGVGIIDHQTGTRDLRRLGTLDGGWGGVRASMVIAAASMAGVPLALGFIAKEAAYEAFWQPVAEGATAFDVVVLVGVVVGSVVTFAYTGRLVSGAFVAPARRGVGSCADVAPRGQFVLPTVVASAVTLALGVVPGLLDGLIGRAAAAPGDAPDVHLALWHGVNAALLLSLLTYAMGTALFGATDRLSAVLAVGAVVPNGTRVYRSVLRNVNRLADRVTGTVQNGSLPVYAGVVLLTAAVLPALALLQGASLPDRLRLVDGVGQAVLVAVVLGSAIGAAAVRRRFSAALFLGVAGYGMAGMFVVHGAPDLALTQTAIETLTTVLFVLVLRRLPDRFERTSAVAGRSVRLAVAVAVGLTVFVFALVAGGERVGPPVSDEMIDRALPDGNGRNVVNVILVDFRGFDTLGEITVLAASAIGAVALARAGRRPGSSASDPVEGEFTGRSASAPRAHVIGRVVNVDQSVSVIFYVMMMASIYLLFAGHNQPGGGFVGGLVAGAAVALRYVAGGLDEVRSVSPLKPWTILGAGVVMSAVTALAPVLGGGAVLDNGALSADLVGIGAMKVTSAVVFDLGVYLVVIGLVLMVVEAFGEQFESGRSTGSAS